MSPVTGQVPVKAVDILRIGVDGWKRERQNEKKKEESMNGVFIEEKKQIERVTTQNSVQTPLVTDMTSGVYILGQGNKLFSSPKIKII